MDRKYGEIQKALEEKKRDEMFWLEVNLLTIPLILGPFLYTT
jgi:hypothetical protein